jgi:outer membrane immunogenic protein
MNRALVLAVVAACGIGSAAHAADLTTAPENVAASASAFNWTGAYAGVHAGYGWADLDTEFTEVYGVGNKPDGFFGGGQVGYNYQFSNNIVLGIEADAAVGDLKDDDKRRETLGNYYVAIGTDTKITALGTVRGRAGYAVDRFLPYITGGFAWANAESGLGFETNMPNSQVFTRTGSDVFTGWTVGAGLEYAVTNNITAKAEYLYADLGSKDLEIVGFPLKADLSSLQTVKFGLNYKF